MPRGGPKKTDKVSAQYSTEGGKEDTFLQGQKKHSDNSETTDKIIAESSTTGEKKKTSHQQKKKRGRPKKTDKISNESSTKGGKKIASLQGQKKRANPSKEKRKVISDSQYTKGQEKYPDWTNDEDARAAMLCKTIKVIFLISYSGRNKIRSVIGDL